MGLKRFTGILAVLVVFSAGVAQAQVFISEWQYNGAEYIEFTNFGIAPVDFAGWSFDDDSRTAGTVDLSSIGLVAPGEAVLLTELSAADFRSEWKLPSSVKIVGSNSTNLGRNDEINLYDAADVLVDRLTYGDQNIPGTIRTQDISGNPSLPAVLGTNNVSGWVLASVGDSYGSYASVSGFIGNPGDVGPVPEPAAVALLGIGALGFAAVRRSR